MIVLLFIFLFFVVSTYAQNIANKSTRMNVLYMLFFILALIAGSRGFDFSDTTAYTYAFQNEAPTLANYSILSKSMYYDESGFFFLAVLVKTFTSSPRAYLLVVSLITMTIMCICDKKYAVYPFLGLCVYVARFYMGRDFIQIRASIAYAILFWAIQYIYEKKMALYFLWVFIAYQFHHSAVVAVPLYFLCNWIEFKKWHIVVGLIIAFIIGGAYPDVVRMYVEDNASDLNISGDYVTGGTQAYVEGKGLLNPLIYFQCAILLLYTYYEELLAPQNKYYYVLRTGYFYSTLILIIFCTYAVLSGRTATIYATLEMAIIPSLLSIVKSQDRSYVYFILGVAITIVFYMNYHIIFK